MKPQFLEILTVTLAANETKEFNIAGDYFELIDSTTYLINVDLLDSAGVKVSSLKKISNGYFSKGAEYSILQISNTNGWQFDIKIAFGFGEVGSKSSASQVQITNTPSVSSYMQYVYDQAIYQLTVHGFQKQVQTLTGSNLSLNIAAAQNTNGIILLDAEIRSIGNEFHTQTLNMRVDNFTQVSNSGFAPAVVNGYLYPIAISEVMSTTPYYSTKTKLKNPVFIPAGMSVVISSDTRTDPNISANARINGNSAFFRAISLAGTNLVSSANMA